jgi:hypothetical protein
MIAEAWRLGPDAPVPVLLPFMDDTALGPRSRAVYSLGRLKAPAAGNRLLLALRDPDDCVRSLAARALTGPTRTARAGAVRRRRPVGAADDPVRRSHQRHPLARRLWRLISRTLVSCWTTRCPASRSRQPGRWASFGGRSRAGLPGCDREGVSDSAGPRGFPRRDRSDGVRFGRGARRASGVGGSVPPQPGHRHRGTGAVAGVPRRPGWGWLPRACGWSSEVDGPRPAAGLCAAAARAPRRGGAERRGGIVTRGVRSRPAGSHPHVRATRRDSFPGRRFRRSTVSSRFASRARRPGTRGQEFWRAAPGRTTICCGAGPRTTGPGGRPVGTGLSGRDRALAQDLSRRGRPLSHGSGLRRAPARRHRDESRGPIEIALLGPGRR